MVFLGYAGSPNFERDVGDRLGLVQSTVSRTVHRVSAALCRHSNELIRWPSSEEVRRAQQEPITQSTPIHPFRQCESKG